MIIPEYPSKSRQEIFSEAEKRGWSPETTRMVIEAFEDEFWEMPQTFSDLLEVLE